MPAATRSDSRYLLGLGGETAELIRSHDWAATPLGPIDGWPQSLKTTVELMLSSRFPMFTAWGEGLTFLYNDAYVDVLGGKHPRAMGRSFQDIWSEIWADISPMIDAALNGRATYFENLPLLMNRDGRDEQTWFTFSYSPVRDDAGAVAGMFCACVETTATVLAEQRTQQAHQRLELALSAGRGVGTWDWDVPDDRVHADERFARLYGVDPDLARQGAAIGEFFKGVHPDDLSSLQDKVDQALSTGELFRTEYRLIQPDGTVRWVAAEGRASLSPEGQPIRFPGVSFDITDRREAAEALRESEARYRTLFDSVETGFCIVQMKFDADDRAVDYMIVEGNPAFEALTGLHDSAGKWVSEIAPGLERHWFDTYGRVALTGEPERFENQAAIFGRWYDVEALRVGEPDERRVAILFTDVTPRRQLERRQAALIALDDAVLDRDDPVEIGFVASQVLGGALDASRVGYGVIDAEAGTIVIARDWTAPGQPSVAGSHLFSDYGSYFTEDLSRGRTVAIADVTTDPRTASDPARLLDLKIHALLDVPLVEGGRPVAQVLVHADAPRAWTPDEVEFVRDFAERTRALIARREAERLVRERQGELQRLADSLPLLVSRVDRDLRYAFNNQAYQDWFGMTPEAMRGRHVREVIGEAAFEKLKPNLDRALAGERLSVDQFSPYSTGARDTRVDYVPNLDAQGRPDGFYAIVQDISERRRAEQRKTVLVDLNDALRDLTDAAEIAHASARILAQALNVSRVGYGVMDTAAETVTIARDYNAPGVKSIAGVIHFRDFGNYIENLSRGEVVVFADAADDPRVEDGGAALDTISARALINLPLIEQGEVVALLFVNNATPRVWSDEDVALVREVAERVRVATERARAVAALRESEARFRNMADNTPMMMWVTDPTGFCTYLNRTWYEYTGQTEEEAEGFGWLDATHPDDKERAGQIFLEANAARASFQLEYRLRRADGVYRLAIDAATPRFGADGTYLGYVGSVVDIDDRREIEDALRLSEARLRFLDELSQATAGLTDADEVMAVTCRLTARHLGVTNCAYADMDPDQDGFSIRGDWAAPGVPHITGHYSLADFGKLAVQELGAGRPLIINDNLKEIDPDEAATFQAIGISATICMPLVKDGRLLALMAIHHAQPHVWTEAELSTIREVTERSWAHVERVGAQAALQESEGRQAFLLKLADALRPLTDPDAVIEVATRMIAERIDADRVGYAEDEPEDGAISVRADHVREGASLRGRYRYEDYGAELLARFRQGETVIRPDIANDLGLSEAEKGAHATLGLGATINVPLLINGRLRAVMFAHWKQAHDISPTLAALIEGAAERVRSAFDRVSAESARRISQSRYQALFDAIDEGFCIIEFIDGPEGPLSDYIHVEANAAYVENAGIPDVVGQKVREMVPDEAQGWIDLYKTVLDTGRPIRFEKELQATARWLELAAFRVEPAERNQVAVLFKDLTARKLAERALERMNEQLEERVEERTGELMAAEEALRQAQKMEAVGQLTGGIAHDFNNLLAGISGALELLSKRMAEGRTAGMERYIEAAQGSAQRAAALTQRLLAFSRRQTLDPRPTDVNRLVGGMEDLIRRSVGPNVQVEVVGAGGLWPVQIDQSQLENALLNLCINARDAMAPDGGRLTIETANKWLDDRHARDREIPPGQYVSLCVTDTGTGMSPEVIARIFDPFFTTKPLGQGTGLGLSMIHGFVRQSGGQVRVYSEPGDGTTMCLYLPRYMGEVETLDPMVDAGVAEGGHGETVLVIDDEETVRMLVTEVLREAGYRVIGAGDGPSGLEILRSDARIDLLITDVGLPGGMNGRQVADAARESRPDLKVLFITGYAENAAVGNGLLDAGMQVMTKPFVMSDLALKVHEMVEG